ncbi:MAG: pyrimidine operon regulatory protein/uracil phosphoribosyltransferase [Pseudomonadota bacterium]|jgi:pyrimidine operon attenuation protein/uracil phosphoribosyltransferase
MSTLQLDAEALYTELRSGIRGLLARRDGPHALVGVWSGGAWLVERLAGELKASHPTLAQGVISSTLHRDDFGSRGMSAGTDRTALPFAVDGCHIVLLDDVLHTGRTIRAVINELYDFGRPASVTLAVLVDRGGRELPIEAAYAAVRVALPASQRLRLSRSDTDDGRGSFSFEIREAS